MTAQIQTSRRQPKRWQINIEPTGTPEDGERAQRRALAIIALRHQAKPPAVAPAESFSHQPKG